MKHTLPRLPIALIGAGLLLAGCAGHTARPGAAEKSAPQATPSETQPARTAGGDENTSQSRATQASGRAATKAPEQAAALPDSTGIAACDDYLASYVACHRAAQIYRPDQIQSHYEAMRTSLLRDAQDPQIRPNLAARCNSLASQLRQALHGKSCQATPASARTTD